MIPAFKDLKPGDTFMFNAEYYPKEDWVKATVETADGGRVCAKFDPIAKNEQEDIVMSRSDWGHFTNFGDIKPAQ
jgi:hypothetical protein